MENLPQALRACGLLQALAAADAGKVVPPPYSHERDADTNILNPLGIRSYSLSLAEKVTSILKDNQFPLVLGGDCSILIGNALALRRTGNRHGLFFIDGHADFYQPEASPTGEVADMDLAIVTGRGPAVIADIGGLKPYVKDEDVVLCGYRDAEESKMYGSQDVRQAGIMPFDLPAMRGRGIRPCAAEGIKRLQANGVAGYWIHLDVDVLDDSVMPAVDYRMPGGLSFAELAELLQSLLRTDLAVGMDVTVFNPSLDKGGSMAKSLASATAAGFG
ncbi:MAG: arginase family protein [Nitrososphaera sp.]|uniref:arginase family protein n=1 Tax=Nitrososphaera sp. TaxID=1971748 RepID=UPI003D6E7A1C